MAQSVYTIKQLEPDKYDARLIERHLSEGKISAKELSDHLANVEDLTDNAEEFEVVLGDDPLADQ